MPSESVVFCYLFKFESVRFRAWASSDIFYFACLPRTVGSHRNQFLSDAFAWNNVFIYGEQRTLCAKMQQRFQAVPARRVWTSFHLVHFALRQPSVFVFIIRCREYVLSCARRSFAIYACNPHVLPFHRHTSHMLHMCARSTFFPLWLGYFSVNFICTRDFSAHTYSWRFSGSS